MTVTATTRARPRPQKRAPVPPEGRAMRPINPRFRELYDKGLTDGDMAAILGAAPSEIILFRETFALPANERPSGMDRPGRGNEQLFRAFYDEGMYDAEIARHVGVSRCAVGLWRRRQKPPLPMNKPYPNRDGCFHYYKLGMTDEQIATVTGLEINSVRHWRYQFDLPAVTKFYEEKDPKTGQTVVKEGVPDYMRYYLLGWNDAEIASAVNRTQSAVYTWRRDHEPRLPPNVRGRPKPGTAAIHLPPAQRKMRHIGLGMTVEELAALTGLTVQEVLRAKKLPMSARKGFREEEGRKRLLTEQDEREQKVS